MCGWLRREQPLSTSPSSPSLRSIFLEYNVIEDVSLRILLHQRLRGVPRTGERWSSWWPSNKANLIVARDELDAGIMMSNRNDAYSHLLSPKPSRPRRYITPRTNERAAVVAVAHDRGAGSARAGRMATHPARLEPGCSLQPQVSCAHNQPFCPYKLICGGDENDKSVSVLQADHPTVG